MAEQESPSPALELAMYWKQESKAEALMETPARGDRATKGRLMR